MLFRSYIQGIYSTVLLKDIVERKKITDVALLEAIIRFMFDNIGNLVSVKKIADTLTSGGRKTTASTVSTYITALKDAFILYEANRYDVKGKQYLQSLEKYYLVDISFRTLLLSSRNMDIGHVLENVVYSDKLSADLEYVYENIVAQMLKADGHELYYYTWPSETSNHLYEVDFLLSNGTKIDPIEVKSSGYKTHKSLDLFCEKFSSRVNKRYLVYTKDLRKEESITYLPVYMTLFL